MKVADSSYLVEGILRTASIFENETFVAPDLSLYEVANTIWKHETIIGDLQDASVRLSMFAELVSNQVIELVRPDKMLLDQTYKLALKHKIAVYDAVFVALALRLGLELKTLDGGQSEILRKELRARQTSN